MKQLIIFTIIFSLLAIAAAAAPECTDGIAVNIQGGEVFDCYLPQCDNLGVEISISPHQDALSGEYNLSPDCTPTQPLQDDFAGALTYACPCFDNYVFNLTTNQRSNGTYIIKFNSTYMITEYEPVFNPINFSNGVETDLININLSAEDNDTAQINLTFSTNSTLGTITNNIFSWQTDYNSEGVYFITFFVTDGKYWDNRTINITILHKDEPTPPEDNGGNRGGGSGGAIGGTPVVPRDNVPEGENAQPENPPFITEREVLANQENEPTGFEGLTGDVVNEGAGITGAVIGNIKDNIKGYSLIFIILLLLGLFLLSIYYKKKNKKEEIQE